MNYILLIIGLAVLIKGADLLVNSASKIARVFGVPAFIVGLSIVAFGTSAPEAAIGILAGIKGSNQITLGNVIGSSIVNITLVLGLTAIVHPLKVAPIISKREIPMSFIVQLTLAGMLYTGLILSKFESVFLLVGFVLFVIYLGISSKRVAEKKTTAGENEIEVFNLLESEEIFELKEHQPEDETESNTQSTEKIGKEIVFLLLGLAGLIFGSNLVVDSGVSIAHTLGLSDRLIGLTVIALGTSLPELVTCLAAAYRKEEGIAVGNIIGSNIFNILFVLGMSNALAPVVTDPDVFIDVGIMLFATVLLFIPAFVHKKISRVYGFVFLSVYILYIIFKISSLG